MNTQAKKCPMCAEQIPLAAVNCKYCGAQFEVTSTGYCQNCHQIREADQHGCCKVCNDEIIDLRVESRLVEEPIQESLPSSKPAIRPEFRKTRNSLLPFGVLAGVLIFAIISAFIWFGLSSFPAISNLPALDPPLATMTFTPVSPPTDIPTGTPHPMPTATPIPTWVTDFAEPMMVAIQNREPDFADDFSQNGPGWQFHTGQFAGPENPGKMEIVDGVMRMSVNPGSVGFAQHPSLRANNFVLQVDANLQQIGSQAAPHVDWRGNRDTGADEIFELWRDGSWYLYFCGNPCDLLTSGSRPIETSDTVTIMIISRGTEYAIYVDSRPLMFFDDVGRPPAQFTYVTDDGSPPAAYIRLSLYVNPSSKTSVVEYDNLKVWDLEKIPNQP